MENNNIVEIKFNVSEEQLENKVLERLESDIEQRIVNKIANKYIEELGIKLNELQEKSYSIICETITEKLKSYIESIYDNYMLKIPTSTNWNSEIKEIALKDYVLEQTRNKVENGVIYKGSYETKTCTAYFNELIEKNVISIAKDIIEKETTKIKNEVNRNLKETFDTATKTMLSEQVFNMLMNNDTYKKMENGIKLLSKTEQ